MTIAFHPHHFEAATPAPAPEGAAALPSDLDSALLALMIDSRGAEMNASQSDIERAHELVERARKDIERAMKRAEEARESAGFWGALSSLFGGDIAKIFEVIAAAALIVATGGAGAAGVIAIAAAGLSAGSTIGKELGLDPNVCKLLAIAGAVAGLATGNLSGAAGAWNTVATVAKTGEAGATAFGGVATVVEGQYRGDAMDAQADATAAQNRQDDAWFRMDMAISLLEQATRDLQRARERVSELQGTEHDGKSALIAKIGAAS